MTAAPITPTFALVDHHGQSVTEATYRGRWTLVIFGFTHCRMVCPRALKRLSEALDALGPDATAATALYITVDPHRDNPDVIRRFLEPAYPRFTGLTGTSEQVSQAQRAFRVFARRTSDPDDPDGYSVPHTAITYLLAPDGSYAKHWPDAVNAATITTDLRALIH